MNKFYTIIATFLMAFSTFAQAPEKMSYQAVIRNSSDALVVNQAVGMKISILQGGDLANPGPTVVYSETQTPTTNINGLVSLEIGTGTPVTGTFAGIDWATGPYFIKTETDPTGSTTYTITGTSQLMSVPYALYAAKSGGNEVYTAGTGVDITTNEISVELSYFQVIGGYSAINGGAEQSIAGYEIDLPTGNSGGVYLVSESHRAWINPVRSALYLDYTIGGVPSSIEVIETRRGGENIPSVYPNNDGVSVTYIVNVPANATAFKVRPVFKNRWSTNDSAIDNRILNAVRIR